ncbi:MAG: ABC-type Fe3+ transport system substrate-binding protein [Kiritimatiellia bacterium]
MSLVNYLLSPEVETALARSAAGQIPLNPAVTTALRVKSPREARAMDVDFAAAAAVFASAAELVQERFLE